jgi:2,4-dienoyl-CoA reductase-like NADH-dependent reductase (Old Yellow Enzyme family)
MATLYDPIQLGPLALQNRIAYGRPFLANPDLPHRLRHRLPLNVPDPGSFFGGTEKGWYTDYPARVGT